MKRGLHQVGSVFFVPISISIIEIYFLRRFNMKKIWETVKEETLKLQEGFIVFIILGVVYCTIRDILRK